MEWNQYAIGGEICVEPNSGDRYCRLVVLDRLHGRQRSGPISVEQLDELIEGLSMLRHQVGGGVGDFFSPPSKD